MSQERDAVVPASVFSDQIHPRPWTKCRRVATVDYVALALGKIREPGDRIGGSLAAWEINGHTPFARAPRHDTGDFGWLSLSLMRLATLDVR
jgi:hypothetical protein